MNNNDDNKNELNNIDNEPNLEKENNNNNKLNDNPNVNAHEEEKKVSEEKIYLRPDGKPDFGILPYFDDYVEFDPEKYKRPEIYFGFVHDQYLVPKILGAKVMNKKQQNNDIEKNDEKEATDTKKGTKKILKSSKKSSFGNVKSLDEIMEKLNLKYIEPVKKEKVVQPPPEENPPEPEEVKDNKSGNKTKSSKDDKSKSSKK